ncbi:MAG: preprotein translocase subunit SecG [Acidobacteriota bacterium]|nr:preprotein translocase subunit SecG [Acidobacteriota bacterium]
MIYIIYGVHIVTCLFLIMVVLLQQGKGADLSVFGGGSTQAAFGARGAATLLNKLTVGCFFLFLVTTMSIGIMQRSGRSSSVMSDVEATPETTEAAAPAEVPESAPPAEEAMPTVDEPVAEPAAADDAPAAAEEAAADGADAEN